MKGIDSARIYFVRHKQSLPFRIYRYSPERTLIIEKQQELLVFREPNQEELDYLRAKMFKKQNE